MNPKNIKKCHTTIINCHTTIAGCHTTIAGCHTTIAGCQTTIAGCQTTIAGCHTTIAGCRTTIAGCRTTIAGCQTTIAGCHTTIADCHTTIAGCRTTFFAFCTSKCFKKIQIRPKLLQNKTIWSNYRNFLRQATLRRRVASAIADNEFMLCWMFGLPIGKRRFGETPPTFCFCIELGDSDPAVALRFTAGYAHPALRAKKKNSEEMSFFPRHYSTKD
jgi:hypothetical protein